MTLAFGALALGAELVGGGAIDGGFRVVSDLFFAGAESLELFAKLSFTPAACDA